MKGGFPQRVRDALYAVACRVLKMWLISASFSNSATKNQPITLKFEQYLAVIGFYDFTYW